MQPKFFAFPMVVLLACAPNIAPANDISGLPVMAYAVASAALDQSQEPTCPDSMQLRSIQFDSVIETARLSSIFTDEPEKTVVVRRAGRRGETEVSIKPRQHFREVFRKTDYRSAEVDLTFTAALQVCEAFGLVELAHAHLSVVGKVGHYQVQHATAVKGPADQGLSMTWQRTPAEASNADTIGSLGIHIDGGAFAATHAKNNTRISGTLEMSFSLKISLGGPTQ